MELRGPSASFLLRSSECQLRRTGKDARATFFAPTSGHSSSGSDRCPSLLGGRLAGFVPLLASAMLLATVGAAHGADDPAAVPSEEGIRFFAETVHPLLERHCYECHGGEDRLRGEFRLTSREGLLAGGALGPAYDEGEPMESHLLAMVSYRDEHHQMPPSGKLDDESLETLRRWIDLGAPYDPELEIQGPASERRGFTVTDEDRDWWAYRPLDRSEPPAVADPRWSANPIDRYVAAQHAREGLAPAAPADPQTLVRRLHYGLLGLPPRPEEVDAFAAAYEQDAEAAVAALVDELLDRPEYGEKWARHWLDLVRYAETNGFERDNPKPHIWRYRDYVVDAFNRDKPYDRFVIEQLAGDEIAEPTMETLAATGYHRLMQWDDEPADRTQHVYDVLADNAQVTAEAFLATTLGCARCHNHKIDPLSQKDFFAFMAHFAGVTPYETEGTLVHWATEEERASFEAQRREDLARLEGLRASLGEELGAHLRAEGLLKDSGETVTLLPSGAESAADRWFYTTERPGSDWRDIAYSNKSWTRGRAGFGFDGAEDPPKGAAENGADSAAPLRTPWESEGLWMRTNFRLNSIPENLLLEISHGESVEIYLNGGLVFAVRGSEGEGRLAVALPPEALDLLQTGQNSLAVHAAHPAGEPRRLDLALRAAAPTASLEALLTGDRLPEIRRQVRETLGRDLVHEFQENRRALERRRAEQAGVPINAVVERGAEPPAMHVHLRGSAHALGDEVAPGVPAVLAPGGSAPYPTSAEPVERDGRASSGRRLALAQWIASPDNALAARVAVNRVWQHHFGRGLVESASDFGRLGDEPTHPELLDWLAAAFVDEGWSLKALHRRILLSETYRLSSAPDSASLDADPDNRHLWRFPMRRLTAEELRDSMLAISGRLNLKQGGPWVLPPMPPEVLATASRPDRVWPVSEDPAEHVRRSLYIHAKRSLRYPMMADFDQAETDVSCAARFVTTVPTQALAMLNSRFVNDEAAAFAARLAGSDGNGAESGSDAGEGTGIRPAIAEGLRLALQRDPRESELDHLETLRRRLLAEQGLDEEKALQRLALVILNLNEFLYLD